MHTTLHKAQSLFLSLLLAFGLATFTGCSSSNSAQNSQSAQTQSQSTDTSNVQKVDSSTEVPEYSGQPYVEINNNQPTFTEEEKQLSSFESYSELDSEGRCGTAFALVGNETMPTEKRGNIGSVKPTGWHLVKYDCVDGKYLYNRCHLIGYQLTGENANKQNLITGTRYLNVDGMLPFEDEVADYVHETNNHVLYRVTPVFDGDNLVASGVQMEAESIEDNGAGVSFNVYCYDNQPGVDINYASGESWLNESAAETAVTEDWQPHDYVLNTKSLRFHKPNCSGIDNIASANKQEWNGQRSDLIDQGYKPCRTCNP
jgi:DNA-entry nuclease